MLVTNENRKSPYAINHRPTVSPGLSNVNRINNQENSKSQLDAENKSLRDRLALKEKELFQKDKIIKDLQEKISKLEIENRNLKRECSLIKQIKFLFIYFIFPSFNSEQQ